MTDFLEKLGKKQHVEVLFIDSKSVYTVGENPVYYFRTKYIRSRFYFTRSLIEECEMYLKKIKDPKNPIDVLTKCVDVGKLGSCKPLVGLFLH